MKIALAQLNYTVGDVAGNTNKIIESVRRAKAEGADLVVFAEQAISGAPSFDLLRKILFGTVRRCVDADCRRMRYGGCDRGASDSHQGGDDQCRSVDSTRKSRPLRGKTEYHRAPRIGISDPFERLRIRYDTGLPLCAGRRRRSFSYPGFRQVGRNRHQHPCPPLPQGRLESSVRRNPEYRLRQGKECGDGQSGRRCYGAGLRRDVGRDGQPGQAGAVAEKFRRGLSGVRYRKSRLQRRVRPCVGERPYPLHLRGGLLRSAGFLR